MNEIDRKILDILLEEKKPVSSRGLALRCDVSINTIRKEIGIFNEEVKGRGFCIASKTAVGHYLEIWDHRLAEPYIREKQLRYRRNQHITNQYSEEVWYILRKCLCSGDYLTV